VNVYEQLQKLIEYENSQDTLKKILEELREIKKILSNDKKHNSQEYYNFVYKLKKFFKDSISKDKQLEIKYNSKTITINQAGWMYDKDTSLKLSAKEAFDVYKYLYKNQDKFDFLTKL